LNVRKTKEEEEKEAREMEKVEEKEKGERGEWEKKKVDKKKKRTVTHARKRRIRPPIEPEVMGGEDKADTGARSNRFTLSGTTRLSCWIDARTSASASAFPTVSLFAGSCKQKKCSSKRTKEYLL
jgi:hypothetical protein